MWIVAKIKTNELSQFKEKLSSNFRDTKYYYPKIKQIKNKIKNEKNILGNYIFCYHNSFIDNNKVLSSKYTKGLKYFLKGCKNSQKQITEFINYCKKNENEEGFIMQSFFEDVNFKKGKFLNGPLADIVFEVLSREKKYLNIILGNKEIKLNKNCNISFLPA